MSIAIVQSTEIFSNGGAADSTFNAGSNFTAGSKVFLLCSTWFLKNHAVTIGGVAAVPDAFISVAGGDTAALWRADGVAGGRSDVVTSSAGSGDASYITGAIIEATGLAPGGPETSGTNYTGIPSNAPTATCSAPTTTAKSLVLSAFSNGTDSNGASVAAVGYTFDYSATHDEGGAGAHKIIFALGTQIITFTAGGVIDWACLIASYAEAAAASPSQAMFFGSGSVG